MQQLDLLKVPPLRRGLMSPIADQDPIRLSPRAVAETSRDAHNKLVKPTLSERRELVLGGIKALGGRATLDEVAAYFGKFPNAISGRFTELAKVGAIRRTGIERETRSGGMADEWEMVR